MPYYAIARGQRTGIFENSEEFNEFRKGKYSCGKKFETEKEAKEYIKNINEILNKSTYAFIDLEFTCSNKISDFEDKKHLGEIISIGIVITDNKGKEISTYYQTVKPKYNKTLTNYCKNLTKLTQEEIDESRPVMEVLNEAEIFVSEYNVSEIICFGTSDYAQTLEDINNYKTHCNYKNVKKFVNRFKNHQRIITKRTINLPKEISLNDLKKLLAVQGEVQHNALCDAIDLSKVYFASIYQPPSSSRVRDYLKERESTLRYKQYRKIKDAEGIDFNNEDKDIIKLTCDIIKNNKNINEIDAEKISALIDDLLALSKQNII